MRVRWYYAIMIVLALGLATPVAISAADLQPLPPTPRSDGQPLAPGATIDSAPPLTAEEQFLAGPPPPVQGMGPLSVPVPERPAWLAPLLPASERGFSAAGTDDATPAPAGARALTAAATATVLPANAPASASSNGLLVLVLVVIAGLLAVWWSARKRTVTASRPRGAAHGPEQPFTINIAPRATTARTPARRAFSIIEVMIAVSILAVALMGLLSGISSLSTADASAKEATVVRQAAQDLCERLQGASWHLLGIPSEPWSWYRRANFPVPGAPAGTDPYAYWTVWNPLTVPNAWPYAFPHTNQVTYYNPPITLNGTGARSIFVNQGQYLVNSSNVQILGPTGQPIPIQEIIVVDCALEIPPPAIIAAAQAQWSGNSHYTSTTPVVGLGIFHDPPGLTNLRIYLEYFNQFPVVGVGNSIFTYSAQSTPTPPIAEIGQQVTNRKDFNANCATDVFRLAVPNPALPSGPLYYLESPDDFAAVGINTVSSAIGIRLMITWDSCTDTPPNVPLYTRPFGTRTQTIIIERRQ